MKRLTWLLPVLMAMLLTGCLKDNPNGGTVVLMGTESDVKPIDQVIPDTLLAFITNATAMDSVGVLDLPTGTTPPDIQGEYMFCHTQLCADNGHGVPRNDTIYFRFGGDVDLIVTPVDIQLHAGDGLIIGSDTTILQADTTIQVNDTTYFYPNGQDNMKVPCGIYGDVQERGGIYQKKSQPQGYVMGSGNDFTAYFTIDYDCEFQGETYQMRRGYIITGTVSSKGIDHAVLACVNISVDGGSSQGYVSLPQKDWIYVYRVRTSNNKFGTAERCQWYNQF